MRIVVPAFNATKTLSQCISAITQSEGVLCSDVFVVDDGNNGTIEQTLAPFHVNLLRTGGSHSAGDARNHGAAGYRGDVLVFVDADVEVNGSAIGMLVEPIRTGQARATVGNYSSDTKTLGFYQAYKQLYLSRVYSRQRTYLRYHFWTALCAIETSAFLELGGFAKGIAGTCEEDTEIGRRMTQSGIPILSVPEATGQHMKPYGLKSLVINDFLKGTHVLPYLLKKDVQFTDNRHASRRDILAVGLAGILLALGPSLMVFPSVRSPFVLIVPLLYAVARHDLLVCFSKPGWFFLLRAILVMYLLDIVRGVCVAYGLLTFGGDLVRVGLTRHSRRPPLPPAFGTRGHHG